jgi:hypothetical protein
LRIFSPFSSKCVAKQCLSVCGLTRLFSFAFSAIAAHNSCTHRTVTGNSLSLGRRSFQYSRNNASNFGDKALAITYEFRMELDRQMAITGFQSR